MNSLQELGFKKEEIEQKVVESIADRMLSEWFYDGETGAMEPSDSRLAIKFHEVVKKHVERQINKLAEEYIVPNVRGIIESVALQATNQWGEKTGQPKTFIEYLTEQANNYLTQPVDYQGKHVERSSYGRQEQTRLVHLVHEHFRYAIESSMKDAVEQVKKQLGPMLQETCKIKLNEIASTLKVGLTTK
jgi:hypothetical protein